MYTSQIIRVPRPEPYKSRQHVVYILFNYGTNSLKTWDIPRNCWTVDSRFHINVLHYSNHLWRVLGIFLTAVFTFLDCTGCFIFYFFFESTFCLNVTLFTLIIFPAKLFELTCRLRKDWHTHSHTCLLHGYVFPCYGRLVYPGCISVLVQLLMGKAPAVLWPWQG